MVLSVFEGGDMLMMFREILKNVGGGVGDYVIDDDNLYTSTFRVAASYVSWCMIEDVEVEGVM